MICRILRICYVLDQYRVCIEAYANGARGDSLKRICAEAFLGDNIPFPNQDNTKIFNLIDEANSHAWDVQQFFNDKVSFAGMLP